MLRAGQFGYDRAHADAWKAWASDAGTASVDARRTARAHAAAEAAFAASAEVLAPDALRRLWRRAPNVRQLSPADFAKGAFHQQTATRFAVSTSRCILTHIF